jgi:hypothetical protein
MRHLILALMIALLPLRGWVGDAMATQMAAHALQKTAVEAASDHHPQETYATQIVAAHAHETWAKRTFDHQDTATQGTVMPPDCLEHTAPTGTDHSDSGCADCAFCQVCHTVALTSSEPNLTSSAHPSALAQREAAPFASAEAALGQKPPIS